MRTLILTAILSLGVAASAAAATCQNPATGRLHRCPAAVVVASPAIASPGIGRTVVVAGPPVAVRPVVRCGPYRCGRAVVARPILAAPAAAPAQVALPARGYVPQ